MKEVYLYSKVAAAFRHPQDRNIKFEIGMEDFAYAPEWVQQSTMYRDLNNAGLAWIANDTRERKQLENEGTLTPKQAGTEPEKTKTNKAKK